MSKVEKFPALRNADRLLRVKQMKKLNFFSKQRNQSYDTSNTENSIHASLYILDQIQYMLRAFY